MQIQPKQIFEVIKGGPEAYVRSLDFRGKSIEQAERMLPEGFNIQYQSRKGDYDEKEHPDDEQYAVLLNTDPDYYVVHLYVNDGVITESEEVYR